MPQSSLPKPDLSEAGLAQVQADLASRAVEADRTAALPRESIHTVQNAGLLTANVSSSFGGAAISAREFSRVFMALGAGDPSVALVSLMTAMQHIAAAEGIPWPKGLYESVLDEARTTPVLLNAALTEPALGSSLRGGSYQTTAAKTEHGWVVHGRKSFVTGSDALDYHLVSVRSSQSGEVARAIVPREAAGIQVVPSWDGIGMRASATHEVVYDGVEIPRENLVELGPSGGPDAPRIGAMFAVGLSAIYVGVAQSAREALVDFLTSRSPSSLGAPLATVERLQDVTGEVTSRIIAAEEILAGAAHRLDSDPNFDRKRISAVKLLTSREAILAVESAVAAVGGTGLSKSAPFERHLRDVLCARPQPPHDDTVIRGLGRAALGVSA
jgi:alkylation response protein AidB-like acyl-CoA dehydrogenase